MKAAEAEKDQGDSGRRTWGNWWELTCTHGKLASKYAVHQGCNIG